MKRINVNVWAKKAAKPKQIRYKPVAGRMRIALFAFFILNIILNRQLGINLFSRASSSDFQKFLRGMVADSVATQITTPPIQETGLRFSPSHIAANNALKNDSLPINNNTRVECYDAMRNFTQKTQKSCKKRLNKQYFPRMLTLVPATMTVKASHFRGKAKQESSIQNQQHRIAQHQGAQQCGHYYQTITEVKRHVCAQQYQQLCPAQ
ncbi:MAG: hypothetical protein H7240_05090 [Glaciimonas sp.]|nr:hypothetical protein [Glaciimonas sp.]